MTKKLIALILVLPIVLMMTLFTAVNTVKLNVKVPVSKIEIKGDKFVSLNLDKGERHPVDYVIYPTTAANKNVVFSVEQVGNQPKADLEYKDGYIYPKSAGSAYACFTAADGGYRAKFHVVVKSTELKEISCSIDKTTLKVGEKTQINTEFIPQSASNKLLEFESSDNRVVSVDDAGMITAKGKGTATITVRSLANENVSDTIEIIVNPDDILSLSDMEITTWEETGNISLTVDTLEDYELSYKVYDENSDERTDIIKPVNEQTPFTDLDNDGNFEFDYEFVDKDFYGKVVVVFIIVTPTRTVNMSCTINRINNLTAEFKSEEELCVQVDDMINWKNHISIFPSGADVEYSVDYSNGNLSRSGSYLATADKMGYTQATITIQSTKYPDQEVELKKEVYVCPDVLDIDQTTKDGGIEYGIEDIWTIGKTDVSGTPINHELTLSFGGNQQGDDFNKLEQKISFITSAPEKVKVENGKIKILDDNSNDIVDINAKLNLPNGIESEKIKIRCVGNGVEVYNFLDLVKATKLQNKAIVLQRDIVDDFGIDENKNNFYQGENVDKIPSTYDTRFYGTTPEVITLLQFKSNLYGNGYVINANNVTMKLDDTGALEDDALFRGPLNFVAMANMASVKAQDNICFAVYENVTINNVELKGCTLQGKEGEQDLTDLNYVGTVVEVLGDNVNIEYSRINNGRTVLRAFGDIDDNQKVINVSVKNSVLSCAREFIVRIGSNCFKNDDRPLDKVDLSNYEAPNLYDDDTFNFPVQRDYANLNVQEYKNKYIKTFMTIENSVLKDSGIFCIGVDSHFSGPMLYNAWKTDPFYQNFEELRNWVGLSSTSYGAKLTFNGDVRMYDWKDINNIDSSTLIEKGVNADSLGGALDFDIKKMIKVYTDKSGNDASIIYKGKYVHGGIVFFGGGKNYGIFEDNSKNFQNIPNFNANDIKLQEYNISLGDVGQSTLEQAAGNKPFYFMIYGANSNFNFEDQVGILNGGYADNCIFFK